MTARSYVYGDRVRSPTELMGKVRTDWLRDDLVCIRSGSEQRGWRCQSVWRDLYESFNSRSRDISWHRIVRGVRFLCRTGKRRGYRDRSIS
jgi:hypothetical protein